MAKIEHISPLAPAAFPEMPAVEGVILKTHNAALKYQGRDDVFFAEFPDTATIAGVFTKSLTPGAPIDWNKANLSHQYVRAILVNAGNANAFTGKAGADMCQQTAATLGKMIKADIKEIYLGSTGVIGEKPPSDYLSRHLEAILSPDNASATWHECARAIATTDTFYKGAHGECDIAGTKIKICGIAKGSGMIAPDMATMLSYIFTDAQLSAHILQQALDEAINKSFNCLTVDSDTSTSDMVLLAATGKANNSRISANTKGYQSFVNCLTEICKDLARQIAMDGEGATKLITVKVTGATSDESAKKIALSIANSPLVKTAIAGEDANWGRIVMAVGKSGEPVIRDKLSINFGGITIAEHGEAVPNYDETPVQSHMQESHVKIGVNINMGHGNAEIYTCDLTHGYITINADYRS